MILALDRRARLAVGGAAVAMALAAGSGARADGDGQAPLILPSGALAQVAPRPPGDIPMEVRQSLGCLLAGTVGTTVALAGGGFGVITNIAAGAGAPSMGALTLGLTGVVFGTFCAVGAVVTPLYVYLTLPRPPPRPVPVERHASPGPALPPVPPPAPVLVADAASPIAVQPAAVQSDAVEPRAAALRPAGAAAGGDLRITAFRSGFLTTARIPREPAR